MSTCRMFSGGREALWEEKLGLAPKFAGNAATAWGTSREADALLRFGYMLCLNWMPLLSSAKTASSCIVFDFTSRGPKAQIAYVYCICTARIPGCEAAHQRWSLIQRWANLQAQSCHTLRLSVRPQASSGIQAVHSGLP